MDENATIFYGSKNIFLFAVQFFQSQIHSCLCHYIQFIFRIVHKKLKKIKQSGSYISEAKGVILKNSSCVVR